MRKFSFRWRSHFLEQLEQQEFDALIVGGGNATRRELERYFEIQ